MEFATTAATNAERRSPAVRIVPKLSSPVCGIPPRGTGRSSMMIVVSYSSAGGNAAKGTSRSSMKKKSSAVSKEARGTSKSSIITYSPVVGTIDISTSGVSEISTTGGVVSLGGADSVGGVVDGVLGGLTFGGTMMISSSSVSDSITSSDSSDSTTASDSSDSSDSIIASDSSDSSDSTTASDSSDSSDSIIASDSSDSSDSSV